MKDRDKMEDLIIFLLSFTIVTIAALAGFEFPGECSEVYSSKAELKVFNRLHKTEYSHDEWIIYEIDIKEKHNRYR